MPATAPNSAPLIQQMEEFQKAFLQALTVPTQGQADDQVSPRAAYQAGCTAMKTLTDQALALQKEWINTLEQTNGAAQDADRLNALLMVNQYMCQSAREAVNARARLWEQTFEQLHGLEPMIPDGQLQATSLQEFVSTVLGGPQAPASADQESTKGSSDGTASTRAAG